MFYLSILRKMETMLEVFSIIHQYGTQTDIFQVWKPYSKLSFSINYVEATKQFRVGFSEKASMFKLPMPYVGASYGYLNGIDDVIKALNLFFEGELDKLEQLLKRHRS